MIPSVRLYGLLFIGVAIAIGVAALLPSSQRLTAALAIVGVYDAIVLILALWDAQRVKPQRVMVQRLPLQRFSINRDNAVTLAIRATSNAVVQIRDGYPAQLSAVPTQLTATLTSNTVQELIYHVHPQKRGEFTWGDIHVQQLGQWGLAWHRWRVPQTATATVYPDLVGLRDLTIRLTMQSAGSIRQARRRGIGTEFAEMRDYTTGDDPRLIDWKATARRDRPLVRVLEPEHEQTLIILLDRGRLMTAQVQGLSRFDWGLNAALSLALTGLNRGDRVGVGIFDRQMHVWIPPERGQQHLSTLIERVASIQPVLLEPDYLSAATMLVTQQTRRALVVLMTDLIDPTASAELLTALGHLTPRYLPFCVTMRDPEVDRQAQALSDTVDAAYSRAVALDLLHQRQLAFAALQQRGVLVLDAPAHQISEPLIERYLQLKARNQL
jgi:uncharacterized protein (DUF58 family)